MTMLIQFAYCADKVFTVRLEAEVELPDAFPHYRVKNIHLAGHGRKDPAIPDVIIKCIMKNDRRTWVHADSQLASDLSCSIGSSLEKVLPEITVAPEDGPASQLNDPSILYS